MMVLVEANENSRTERVWSRKSQRLHVTMSLSQGTAAVAAHALSRNYPANSVSAANRGAICQVEGIVGIVVSYSSKKSKKSWRRQRIIFNPNELQEFNLDFREDDINDEQEDVEHHEQQHSNPSKMPSGRASTTYILRAAAHDVTDSACSSTRTSIALHWNKQSR